MTRTILQIDASARLQGSTTRHLTARIAEKLTGKVVHRDLTDVVPPVTEAWIAASFTSADQRSTAQRDTLALSDSLVAEVQAADILVIGVPIYNFGVPAALKAWIDQIARAGVTFRYTESGPEGLLTGKRAVLAVASGGVPVGSEADFATSYMRQVLGFLGITDVQIVAADAMMADAEAALRKADKAIDALAA